MGEEANGGASTVTSTTKPYLPTGFTKVTGTNLDTGLTSKTVEEINMYV